MNKGRSKKLPNYKNPPVNEVVCGLSFKRIDNFKIHHIGLFYQTIKDEFPIVEHALRLEDRPPELDLNLKDYLPRVWFIKSDQQRLIQLQDDRLYFNWRRIKAEEPYPQYKSIIKDFKKYLLVFEKFLEDEKLGTVNPERCELSYINHIPKGEGWDSFLDINNLFRDIRWNTDSRFLPAPIHLGGQVTFKLPDNKGYLDLTLQQAKRKTDKIPMFVLQNKATGIGEDKNIDAVWEWFNIAHEWIVCGFTDLTTDSIQEDVWQRY